MTSSSPAARGKAPARDRETVRARVVGEAASGNDEEVVVRDLDLDVLQEVRQLWAFYRDRRPDAYGSLVAP